MIRAVLSLCFIIAAFVSPSPVLAQRSTVPTAAEIAAEEGVRRQEALRRLRMKLGDAQNLQQKGRLNDAVKVYEEAVAIVPLVAGVETAEPDRRRAIDGLVTLRLHLAREAAKRGDFAEAEAQVTRAVKVDPISEPALKLKHQIDRAIADRAGTVPSPEAIATIPEVRGEKILTATLVQDGKLFYEMGKLEEAELKLRQARMQDPSNQAAYYYLNLINEERFARQTDLNDVRAKERLVEVAEAWAPPIQRDVLPVPNPFARTNLVHTSAGRRDIMSKMDRIRLNQVFYDQLPLIEVLRSLGDEVRKRDLDEQGVNFLLNPTQDAAAQPIFMPEEDPSGLGFFPEDDFAVAVDLKNVVITINPPLHNIRLVDVLDAIISVAEEPIKYTVKEYAIEFSPKARDPVQLQTRIFRVDPNTFQQGLESVGALSLGDLDTGTGGGGGGRGGGGGGGRGGGQGGDQDTGFSIPRVNVAGITGGQGGGQQGAGQTGVGLSFVTRTNRVVTQAEMVREFFTVAGVDLLQPGRAVFFNDRTGVLMVRGTSEELEIIQSAVETLNIAPPQVTIEAKFAEISQEDARAIGFDWFIGNTLLHGGNIGAQAGTAPSFQGAPSVGNPSGIFPGPGFPTGDPFLPFLPGAATIPDTSSDGLLTQGLRHGGGNMPTPPALATITGILTDPQFRLVIRALEQRRGVDLLSAPKLTTLSGRQAQISVLDLVTVVTSVELEQTGSGGATEGTLTSAPGVLGTQIEFGVQPLPFGPVLDVIPYVSADRFSVQMTIIPTITEFLGYDDPGAFVPQAQGAAGNALGIPLTAVLPLPRLRMRQVTTSCVVWDGQTVVLGGLISENVSKLKDKVPVLGDLPFIGRLFRSEGSATTKKNLVIFVTPTIIDPAGNRMHSDEELPFARQTIPPQNPIVP